MATERYLLDELTPIEREAFEEHLFDCPECAIDLRAAMVFVDEAKVQLPELTAAAPVLVSQVASAPAKAQTGKRRRMSWWSAIFANPAFAAPVFATLLIVVGYQNLVTLPAMRSAASEPHLSPWSSLHAGTRSGERATVVADRRNGVALPVELPAPSEMQAGVASYSFDLYDSQGKAVWTQSLPVSKQSGDEGETLSVVLPGAGLEQGAYTLTISGVSASGERKVIQRHVFDIQFSN